jgi:tetratricopeptide (TPR) repeat protein
VLVALGETRQAVEEYLVAINFDPEQPAHYLNLAIAYQKLGETELEAEAMENYRRLLRQHP